MPRMPPEDALRSVDPPRYGSVLTYFAQRILLHDAYSWAVELAANHSEPAVVKVLEEAIEARWDYAEFPEYATGSRKGWLPPGREVVPPLSEGWKRKLRPRYADETSNNWEDDSRIPSATRLKTAGVGFGKCDMIHQTHLDLSGIRRPILRLPIFLINHEVESLLRNLIALERIKSDNPFTETPLASFIKLMDNLIDTAEDVLLLTEAGVLVHHLGSDEAVAEMWNELGSGLRHYPSYRWAEMITNINLIVRDKRRLQWIEFKRKHMSRPWLVFGTFIAVIVVSATIIQTVFTAFQVFLNVPVKIGN
ncbi:hypothetical protein R1flu_015083 [Riccia fluitans]|uniref:Uncharacterized protein n=1 Tax=Riccia fluitans TaxID=41844 RepID=A0ABD1YLP5_9MARC